MLFDDIIGQDRAVAILQRALENARVPSAFLFAGPPGCGRMGAAVALAASLNCETGVLACGTCPSCRMHAAGTHPDLHVIGLRKDKREIVIEQIREDLVESAHLLPFSGRAATFIVDDAQEMNLSASNALLRTLEEPPATTRIVLVAASRDSVLPTIASRCQTLAFAPLARRAIELLLVRQGVEPSLAAAVAPLARGSMERALFYAKDRLPERLAAQFAPLASLREADSAKLLDLALRWGKNREDALAVLDLMAEWYRDAMVLSERGGPEQILHRSSAAAIGDLAAGMGRTSAFALEAVENAREALEGNANVELALDDLFLEIREEGR